MRRGFFAHLELAAHLKCEPAQSWAQSYGGVSNMPLSMGQANAVMSMAMLQSASASILEEVGDAQ